MSRRPPIKPPKTRFAHVPGGGPTGKTCGDCGHRRFDGRTKYTCQEAARMAGLRPEACQPVPATTDACKYFTPATPRPGDPR
ncbi:hypothetical protein SAMN05421508_11367 [Caenispirillum bisanense]|uniref:Uncharacterized protein n=1 Tax=Caenispirillum bisanense TaxID=414052 RepID=A0A286GYQ6_9PROT|nr:hypothetical protein SAMN05421508_11367 [Caenispirillum bisanense]